MEIVIEAWNSKRTEPNAVSVSTGSLSSRSKKLRDADDLQETEKSENFSIRGYVAEVRKRDWKISWPFPVLDGYNKLKDPPNCIPPLHVTQFRWWGSQNCLKKTDVISATKRTAVDKNGFGDEDETGICSTESQDDDLKLHLGVQLASEKDILEGRELEKATPENMCGGQCHPSLCCNEKEKDVTVLYPYGGSRSEQMVRTPEKVSQCPAKETYRNESSCAEENTVHKICGTVCDATESFQREERVDKEIRKGTIHFKMNNHQCNLSSCQTTSTSGPIFYGKNASEIVSFRLNGKEETTFHKEGYKSHDVSDLGLEIHIPISVSGSASELSHKNDLGFTGSNVHVREHQIVTTDFGSSHEIGTGLQNGDSLNATTIPSSRLHPMAFNGSEYEFSENNDNVIGNGSPDQGASKHGTSHGRKIQKVRLLTDIIRNEALNLSEKAHRYSRDAEDAHVDPEDSPDACIRKDVHSGIKSSMTGLENSRKTVIGKKRNKGSVVQDKGSPLMQQSKNAGEKVQNRPVHAEMKHSHSRIVNSKAAPDASPRVGLPHALVKCVSTQSKHRKSLEYKKKNKVSQVKNRVSFLTTLKEDMYGKVQSSTVDAETDNNRTGIHCMESSLDAINGRGLHRGPATTNRKDVLNKRRKKIPQVEHYFFSPEETSSTTKHEAFTDVHSNPTLKASKKHREQSSTKACEDTALDDIPMDIVELMAKNQHERHLSYAENAAQGMYDMSQSTANVKSPNVMHINEVLCKEFSALCHKNSSVRKVCSSNATSGIHITGENADKQLDGYTHNVNRKHGNRHMDIVQTEQSCVPAGFSTLSRSRQNPSSRIQFLATDLGRNYNGWSANSVEILEACHGNQTISQQNSGEQAHQDCSIPLNSSLYKFNGSHDKFDELYNATMFSQFLDSSPKTNQSTTTHGTPVHKTIIPSAAPLTQKHKASTPMTNKGTAPTYGRSCGGNGNEDHPKMVAPADLYTNDTISAMNLLRLMDQGASSSRPVNTQLHTNQEKLLMLPVVSQSDYLKLFELKNGVSRNSEACVYPMPVEYFDPLHHLKNSSEPLNPLPRFGLTYPALETASTSNDFRRPVGFTGCFPTKVLESFPRTQRREKENRYHSPTQSTSRSHGSVSQYANSKQSHGLVPISYPQENILSASAPTPNWTQSKTRPLLMENFQLGINNKDKKTSPVECCSTDICTVNRNPAEFSIPEAGNAYMIGSEDLKPRNMFASKDRTSSNSPDGHKRRRMMKLTALQGF